MARKAMNPKDKVSIYRNSIRVTECTHLELLQNQIGKLTKGMEALHKTQLLSVRESFRQRDYIAMTDYKILTKLIARYSESLRQAHASKVDDSMDSKMIVDALAILPEEAAAYEAEFERLQKEQAKNSNASGNFSIKIRPDAAVATTQTST